MCAETHGTYSNCPCCSVEEEIEVCQSCNGSGVFYFDENGTECSEDSPEMFGWDWCPDCKTGR